MFTKPPWENDDWPVNLRVFESQSLGPRIFPISTSIRKSEAAQICHGRRKLDYSKAEMVIPVSWLGKPVLNMIDGDFLHGVGKQKYGFTIRNSGDSSRILIRGWDEHASIPYFGRQKPIFAGRNHGLFACFWYRPQLLKCLKSHGSKNGNQSFDWGYRIPLGRGRD